MSFVSVYVIYRLSALLKYASGFAGHDHVTDRARGTARADIEGVQTHASRVLKPDAGVLRRAQRGDRKALERFFGWHLPLLKRWASQHIPRWLERHADADDFVQRAAIKTLNKLHHLSPERDATTQSYMRQILLNLVRDDIRKVGRSPDHVQLSGTETGEEGGSSLDVLVRRATWQSYRAALRQLSACDRVAVVGRIQKGLSYERLRCLLRVATVGAARAVVRRATQRIVRLMSVA